jgi:hypothetical protein
VAERARANALRDRLDSANELLATTEAAEELRQVEIARRAKGFAGAARSGMAKGVEQPPNPSTRTPCAPDCKGRKAERPRRKAGSPALKPSERPVGGKHARSSKSLGDNG